MALTTVSSLSEMYSGNAPPATNDAVITSTEKAPGADVPEVDPTSTMESEDTAEKSKDGE